MEKDRRKYEKLLERDNVSLKVPKIGPYMAKVEAHFFELHGKPIRVNAHFRNGLAIRGIKKTIILSRLFFGISPENLGKKIVAKVEVVEKTTQRGPKYLLLNIFKSPSGTKAEYDLKFSEEDGDIIIPGTNTKIQFKKR